MDNNKGGLPTMAAPDTRWHFKMCSEFGYPDMPDATYASEQIKWCPRVKMLKCPAHDLSKIIGIHLSSYGMDVDGVGGQSVTAGREYKNISQVRFASNQIVFGDADDYNGTPNQRAGYGKSYISCGSSFAIGPLSKRHDAKSNISYVDGHVDGSKLIFKLADTSWLWWERAPWGNP